LILASDDGDIAYLLLGTHPIRKNKTPYAACHVQDGTTSDNDWEGIVKPKDLYRVINPKKGYIVTANNRVVTDNVETDMGATSTTLIRA
jgi:penicillin amidase